MRKLLVIGLICFLSGIVFGYFVKQRSIKNHELSDRALAHGAIASRDIMTLRCFYNGNSTQAVRMLRSSIAIHTSALEGILKEIPPDQRDTNLVGLVYRSNNFMSDTNR